ncbi:MAG: putative DNA-binding domain-containing protein [Pseudomonadota bacterium]
MTARAAPSLVSLQTDFQNYLLGRSGHVAEAIRNGAGASKAAMLGIYRHAYGARLVEVLRNDFPKLHLMLGDEAFGTLARAYLAGHPSTYRSVRWLGSALPDFLTTEPPYRNRPALAQMAAFQWAQTMAFDSADAAPVTANDLARIPAEAWGSLRLRLHPSINRVALSESVVEAWARLARGEAAPPFILSPPITWLVWRRRFTVHYRALSLEEDAALACAAAGNDFATICAEVALMVGEGRAALRAAELLHGWLATELVSGLDADALCSA